jgi:lysozyme
MIGGVIRHLQGERPGMKAGAPGTPIGQDLAALLYPDIYLWPGILIQQQVQLADVSFWQGDIDFAQMREAGLAGAIIRAGQRNWVDSRFKVNWQKAKAAGLPRGSYWFYDSREDPKRQAELWWSLVQDDYGELIHIADFEENYGGPYGKKEHFKTFLAHFQELSRFPDHRIAIYTGFYWWMARVGADPHFKRFGLWLAWYADMSLVRVPAPWDAGDLLFWQYTSSGDGADYGVSSQEIDLNWYCCSIENFNWRFNLIGEPMPDYIYSITPLFADGCSVRPEPDTGNTKILPGLAYGRYAFGNRRVTIAEDKWENAVQVNKAGDIWLEVQEVDGRALTGPAYIAEVHLGKRFATIKQINPLPEPEPPPSGEEITITQTFTAPGYTVTSTASGNVVTTTLKPTE